MGSWGADFSGTMPCSPGARAPPLLTLTLQATAGRGPGCCCVMGSRWSRGSPISPRSPFQTWAPQTAPARKVSQEGERSQGRATPEGQAARLLNAQLCFPGFCRLGAQGPAARLPALLFCIQGTSEVCDFSETALLRYGQPSPQQLRGHSHIWMQQCTSTTNYTCRGQVPWVSVVTI